MIAPRRNQGRIQALRCVSRARRRQVAVGEGEFVSIVGPNGAGKTTLVNLLTGLLVPTKGEVYFKGRNISGVGPVALAERGMARTFQLVQIFPQLTVAETIAAAVVTQQGKHWRLFSSAAADADDQRASRGDRPHLRAASGAWTGLSRLLSQGEKKLLDVASAFALKPEVILLDEPTSGVSTAEKHGLMKTLIGAAKPPRASRPSFWSSTTWTWSHPTRSASSRCPKEGAGGPAARAVLRRSGHHRDRGGQAQGTLDAQRAKISWSTSRAATSCAASRST